MAGAGWVRLAGDDGAVAFVAALAVAIGGGAVVLLIRASPAVRTAVVVVAGAALGSAAGLVAGADFPVALWAGLTGSAATAGALVLVPFLPEARAAICVGSTVPLLLAGPVLVGLRGLPGG